MAMTASEFYAQANRSGKTVGQFFEEAPAGTRFVCGGQTLRKIWHEGHAKVLVESQWSVRLPTEYLDLRAPADHSSYGIRVLPDMDVTVNQFANGVEQNGIALAKLTAINAHAREHLSPTYYQSFFLEAINCLQRARQLFTGK